MPLDAVVDPSAMMVMIGAGVVTLMGLTFDDLEPREAYITALETLETPRGVTRNPVEFLLGRGPRITRSTLALGWLSLTPLGTQF